MTFPTEPDELEMTLDFGILGELGILVKYYYAPAEPGRFYGPPEDCYPDEPEELEVVELAFPSTPHLTVTFDELEEWAQDTICEVIRDKWKEEQAAAEEAHAENMGEQWRLEHA